ncbi:MAG: DUF971 domain-containing protein [Ignavibacteriaceae bacterium]|nr:DUF971 domain-containing protein [Ignavibacteriaceae bacterium]MCC6551357.1 DUF971 domain-containing protein [Ignavibacteriaceae bacterium]
MNPTKIYIKDGRINFDFPDGLTRSISIKYLRDECPCAGCKGETILLRTYRPAARGPETPEMYKITGIQPVGSYALQISYKDGHTTGLYTWEYLKTLWENEETGVKQNYDTLL